MTQVASIVEGDGEVAALPVLLRRLNEWLTPDRRAHVLTPIRVQKDRFLNRQEEFARYLQLASAKAGASGWVLVLLDADDDCPADKGPTIAARAAVVLPHRRIAVVFANREYEAWFIAGGASLDGVRGFIGRPEDQAVDAETPRNAKGWMRERMPNGYGPTVDQPAFSARLDLPQAHARSRSFRKLCAEWSRHTAIAA